MEALKSFSIPELIGQVENDIENSSHPTQVATASSQAARELEKRAHEHGGEIVRALGARISEMNGQPLVNEVKKSVRDGLNMLLTWVQGE
jgi:hypothetical protein